LKQREIDIIEKLNGCTDDKIQISKQEYSRFDAYNSKAIFEIKHRNQFYADTMIEFDKYSFNQMYAVANNFRFMYLVQMREVIYVFDISQLTLVGYNFKWSWRILPTTTEFQNESDREKYVGYINVNQSIKNL